MGVKSKDEMDLKAPVLDHEDQSGRAKEINLRLATFILINLAGSDW